jgi:hypothetical protein
MMPEEVDRLFKSNSSLYDFAAAIEAATIERCAKVCDEVAEHRSTNEMQVGARLCADAIRALAKEKS